MEHLHGLVQWLFCLTSTCTPIRSACTGDHYKCVSQEQRCALTSLRLSYLIDQSYEDPATLVAHSATKAQDFSNGMYDEDGFGFIDAVRYCFLHVSLYGRHVTQGHAAQQGLISHITETEPTNTRGSISWSNLWKAISSAVRKYFRDRKWKATHSDKYWQLPLPILTPDELLAENRALAGKCLEIMGFIESETESKPIFPDELVSALGLFILPEDFLKYPRLARLLHDQEPAIHAEEENAAQGQTQGASKAAGAEGTVSKEGPDGRSEDGLDEQHKSEVPS